MEKYNYLKECIYNPETKSYGSKNLKDFNVGFARVFLNEIVEAEKKANIIFPKALKEFWLKIGHGNFSQSINTSFKSSGYITNELRWPKNIADIITDPENAEGFILYTDNNEEMLEDGYFPFFEEGDSSSFLWMKPEHDRIYDMCGDIVEEHFEDFIYKLYHVHPQYYLFTKEELEERLEEERKQLEIEKQGPKC